VSTRSKIITISTSNNMTTMPSQPDHMDEFCKQYTNGWVWIATVIKMYYARGMTYVGIPAQVITLLTFLKVWEETFVYFGVTTTVMYGVFPLILVSGCVLVGWLDTRIGIWSNEGIMLSHKVTPLTRETYNIIKNNEDMLKTLTEQNALLIEQMKKNQDQIDELYRHL
jgi:hypothetical protein